MSLLITLVIFTSFAEKGTAQGPKEFSLTNFNLNVEYPEYFLAPAYDESLPDNFQIAVTLTNKAGKDVPFTPTGEFYFLGESGKEYFSYGDKGFDLSKLKGFHESNKKDVKDGITKEVIPEGVYKWGFGAQIDRDDEIVAIIYRDANTKEVLELEGITPFVNERPTDRSLEK